MLFKMGGIFKDLHLPKWIAVKFELNPYPSKEKEHPIPLIKRNFK